MQLFKKLLFTLLLTPFLFSCAEKNSITRELEKDEDYTPVCIGFYNVENLFDTVDTEGTEDTEFTPDGASGWDTERYRKKLSDLAKVIGELGTKKTPHGASILGLSEVENRKVLEDLVETEPLAKRNYRIAHHNSPDERGIDVAFIYRPDYFKLKKKQSFKVDLEGDDKTRDQLLMTGELLGERIHFLVAHWPSRGGGQAASEPDRIAAAEVGRKVIDSLQKADPDAKIVYMGDLNDDPINKSVNKVLQAKGSPKELKDEELFNPMYKFYEKGIGTLAWRDNWNLFDQILLSKPLIEGDLSSFRYYKAEVHDPEYLKQEEGNYKGYPFRTYVGSTYKGGYSDHFPVYAYLVRESKDEHEGDDEEEGD